MRMTSKERLQAVMRHEPVDRLPLTVEGICHGWAKFAQGRYPNPFERVQFYQELGLDCGMIFEYPFDWLPDSVKIREWQEQRGAEAILHKEYATSAGTLRQVVRDTDDYLPLQSQDQVTEAEPERGSHPTGHCGKHIPLFCDHNVPATRSLHYLVENTGHLDGLEQLLNPLAPRAVDRFYQTLKEAKQFCNKHQIVLSLYAWGVGDPLMWLSGVEPILAMAMEDKETLHRYVEIVSRWHRKTMEVALDAGVDHIVRRGWYESTDFWSPALYREFLLEPLRQEVTLAHQAGVTVDYVMASGSAPLLEMMAAAGIDMLSNLDPLAPNTDIRAIRQQIGGTVALCGGINNWQVLEQGSEEQVRQAVLAAIDAFTPSTGCLLAPSDVIFNGEPAIMERNFHVMVDTWKKAAW